MREIRYRKTRRHGCERLESHRESERPQRLRKRIGRPCGAAPRTGAADTSADAGTDAGSRPRHGLRRGGGRRRVTILEAAAALATGKISSQELTKAAIQRIENVNPKLNAFITL